MTTYYPDGHKKSETDAEGNVTSYVYDAYGQVIKKTNPDGTMNLTAYDGLQREKATYFQAGENGIKQILTATSYEFAGYNFDIYTALDTSASHSCKGLKTTKTTYITEDKQVISETLTDIKEHTIYEKTNGETKRTSAYYANGQLARQTDALGNITKYEYGYLNKVTKTYTPFNTKSNGSVNYSVAENQYDKNGNVTLAKQTVQKQDSDTVKYSVTENQYNAQGLLTQVTLSDGTSNGEKNITKYFYNNAGIQTKMYTGLNSTNDSDYMTTNYEYDAWGHLVRTTDSTGYNSGATTYDLNGNALTVTDANGNVTTNTYDALNRVLTANTICSDTSKDVSKSYAYDSMGRITKSTRDDLTTSYTYDVMGRKSTEAEYTSVYATFKGFFYVGVSQYVDRQIVGINHLLMYSYTSYEYDSEMRVTKVKENGDETASYTYDANGNKASETLANGVVSTYTYNGCNKITSLVTKSGNSTISEYEYSYYLDGSDACKVRSENGIIETTNYEYDGLKRLTEEAVTTGNSTDTYAYEYDDYGNRVQMTATGSEEYETVYSYNDAEGNYTALLQEEVKTIEGDSDTTANELASSPMDLTSAASEDSGVETTVYIYDANGNQITKTTDDKTETYTYDGLNQLIGFTDGETVASYAYNVDGLRIKKTVDDKTIHHVWDGSQQIIADVVDNEFYEANCYLRGTNLVATYNYQNGVKSGYTYYTQNAHGDVVNLTDETGAVTKSYTYDAFGVEQNIDDADDNAFRYCGEYYDSESGTIYLRARYYDPAIGRFISRDSVTGENTDPLSLNLYTYCHNNPIIGIDPSGHIFNILIGAGIGAVVSGGISLVSSIISEGGINKDNWKKIVANVAVDMAAGAISGGLAATGVLVGGQMIVNGAINGLASIAHTYINRDKNTSVMDYASDAAISVGVGVLGGKIGGNGTASKHLTGHFSRLTKKVSKSLSGFGKSAVNLIKGNTSGAKQIFNNSKKVLRNGAKYYFSQVRTQSVKEGLSKKTVGGIFKASIPGAIKSMHDAFSSN